MAAFAKPDWRELDKEISPNTSKPLQIKAKTPNIKTEILICCPYKFSFTRSSGEKFVEVSIRFIFCDH